MPVPDWMTLWLAQASKMGRAAQQRDGGGGPDLLWRPVLPNTNRGSHGMEQGASSWHGLAAKGKAGRQPDPGERKRSGAAPNFCANRPFLV